MCPILTPSPFAHAYSHHTHQQVETPTIIPNHSTSTMREAPQCNCNTTLQPESYKYLCPTLPQLPISPHSTDGKKIHAYNHSSTRARTIIAYTRSIPIPTPAQDSTSMPHQCKPDSRPTSLHMHPCLSLHNTPPGCNSKQTTNNIDAPQGDNPSYIHQANPTHCATYIIHMPAIAAPIPSLQYPCQHIHHTNASFTHMHDATYYQHLPKHY